MDEARLLDEFRKAPSRESLQALLLAHQQRVYNACFQVLGRPADAEDAAQEVLLKLAAGARTVRDADAFRGWIYRVSLRAAIDLWRRREATRARETRAAMTRPAPPLDDRDRIALFEAMENLDDGERSLVLEHYFEKVPLEDLGVRRGVSSVAIWKRIEKAREKLKRLLLAGGFVAASDRVTQALECATPIAAPPALLSEGLLMKILAGGAVMGASKSPTIAGLIAVGVLVLISGVVGYQVLQTRKFSPPTTTPREHIVHGSPAPVSPQSAVESSPGPDATRAPSTNETLVARLNEYKALFRAWNAEVEARGQITVDFHGKAREWGIENQPLIFEDPATFFSFLADPAHEDLAGHLIGSALNRYKKEGEAWVVEHWKFGELPSDLTDGLLRILKSSQNRLKAALLAWMHFLQEPSVDFDDQIRRQLDDPDPAVQAGGIIATARGRALDPSTLEKMRQVFEAATDFRVRNAAMDAIARTNSSDVQNWIASKLEANNDPASVQAMGRAAYWRLSFLRSQDPASVDSAELDRYAAALGRAITVQKDWFGFSMVVQCALQLPSDRAIPILESAVEHAHTDGEKRAVEMVAAKMRAGPIRGNKVFELEREFRTMASMK